MPVRFLHTADWQIGMRAGHVAEVADKVRAARIETARRITQIAKEQQVDFVLIAGDLFENNGVGNDVVHKVLGILEQADAIPVYILPGNHDLLGPESVYERRAFQNAPQNVVVLRTNEPQYILGHTVALLAAPVAQKRSEQDPTSRFAEAGGVRFRVGVAHGSPRIEGNYQRDDNPIALDAARRAGLDYLALGHWHSWLQIDERTVMPGTPEPTSFDEESGYAALVTLREDQQQPAVQQIKVGGLTWVSFYAELDGDNEGAAAVEASVRAWAQALPVPEQTLVRVKLSGYASPDADLTLRELNDWLQARFLFARLEAEELRPLISAGRMRELAESHPFLDGVLGDLLQLSVMADPMQTQQQVAAAGVHTSGEVDLSLSSANPLPNQLLRKLLEEADYDTQVIDTAIRKLSQLAGKVVWR